jgi:predicted O-linked N-acetylglucosamine transferase (SPINDLY family)
VTNPAETRFLEQFSKAQVLQQQGQLVGARQAYQEILDAKPDHFDALNAMGVLAGQSKDLQQAIQYFERAIAVKPGDSGAHCNRGLALKQLNQPDAALACLERAIVLDPKSAIAHYSRAETLKDLGRPDEALASYDEAIAINPGFVHASYRRGVALQQIGRLDDAIASYDQVIRLKPDHFDAHANRARSLFALGWHAEALTSCDYAIALKPGQAPLYLLRGDALCFLDKMVPALTSYEQAISMNPDDAEAHCRRGIVLLRLNKVESIACFDRAIAIKPDYAEAYVNRGHARRRLRQFDLATSDYKVVAALAPDFEFIPGNRLESSLQVCDWSDLDALLGQIAAGIENDRRVCQPLTFMLLMNSPRLQHKAARIWVDHACRPNNSLGPLTPRMRSGRLKVGYFSADFREHPVGRLVAQLIEIHDRSRFEVVAFSFTNKTDDPVQQRLVRAFDRFIDVRDNSCFEIASLARDLDIDIAVDLSGYTEGNRTNIFALRAAPIQVNYLGYPGTMGAEYMDYLIGDHTVIPGTEQGDYTERIIYFPDSFIPFDSSYAIADKTFTRQELGLPAHAFVFCCFNNPQKITPTIFDSWMKIMVRVRESVLWLSGANAMAVENLRKEAARRGVEAGRLIFAERLASLPHHVARLRAADLFLDTLPYNAHATALDALRAGLPVLTCEGKGFAGRVAASCLRTIGVPQLITDSISRYEEMAVDLALNPQRLAQIRTELREKRLTCSLFDASRYVRNLEAAYTAMHDRYEAGLPPNHLEI